MSRMCVHMDACMCVCVLVSEASMNNHWTRMRKCAKEKAHSEKDSACIGKKRKEIINGTKSEHR